MDRRPRDLVIAASLAEAAWYAGGLDRRRTQVLVVAPGGPPLLGLRVVDGDRWWRVGRACPPWDLPMPTRWKLYQLHDEVLTALVIGGHDWEQTVTDLDGERIPPRLTLLRGEG